MRRHERRSQPIKARVSIHEVARINDLGGLEGFGPIDTTESSEPFHADWEARVYALAIALLGRGLYNLDEFRDAIERLPPLEYLGASYYQRWLAAIETLLVERGVIDATALRDALRV
jgi:nitrile hydratase